MKLSSTVWCGSCPLLPRKSMACGFAAIFFSMASAIPAEAMDLTLSSEQGYLPLVGQTMTWNAASSDSGTVRYRFRAQQQGAAYRMIRDYGPLSSLEWAADREGVYVVEVSAKNIETGETVIATQTVVAGSRVTGNETMVTATSHPLVFLFSAPACASGGRMRVKFQIVNGEGAVQPTPYRNCAPGSSMNFYLAGMYADTDYVAQAELDTGAAITQSSSLPFRTGSLPGFSWTQTVLKPASIDVAQPVLLATTGGGQVATDLSGKVIWFNPPPVTYATAFESGGYLWGFLQDQSQPIEQQGIRKVDLMGRTVLETNAARVNEQLATLGKRAISSFHHEVRTLPDGRVVALAAVEQLLADVQGPGTFDVLGDMIIVFDRDLQVLWTWDTFDHLNVSRSAMLGEVCSPGGGGCPPYYLSPSANDWTHGNAVRQTPDGGLLYSARHQDWLLKIDYANGLGDGHVIWRLGKDGDFTYTGSVLYPWFSHQHDSNFESASRIVVFDNGNTRISADGVGDSRGQVIELNEQARTASLVLNADLGVYSVAVGSAQRLRSGNYHFNAGLVPTPAGFTAYALEVDRTGKIVSSIEGDTLLYRSFRITNMYTPN